MRVRIARDELRRLRELTVAINQLEREITELVQQIAPQLLTEPRFGPLIAAKLVGEIAGAQRFATPAKLARASGVAPIPAGSGNTQRHRLDQGGNRQINAALHRVIVTRALSPAHAQLHRPAPPRRQDHPRSDPLPHSATSPAASGTYSKPPHPNQDTPTHQALDRSDRTSAVANRRKQHPMRGDPRNAPQPA